MADLNFLNSIFDQENFLLNLDKDDFDRRVEKQGLQDELGELFNDDALNMLLKSQSDYNSLFDVILNTESELSNNGKNECSSDSGLSCEQSFSPTRNEGINNVLSPSAKALKDISFLNLFPHTIQEPSVNIADVNHLETNTIEIDEAVEFVKEEVVEYEEIPIDSELLKSSNSDSLNYISSVREGDVDTKDNENDSECMDRNPILLSYLDSRTINLISSSVEYNKHFKHGTSSPLKNTSNKRSSDIYSEEDGSDESDSLKNITEKRSSDVPLENDSSDKADPLKNATEKKGSNVHSEKDDSDESDVLYPRLQLSSEEQKLALKEGIKLPTHYPLTKSQEKELKRIRRKIRNKISAQDSRRRKKEYIDRLEEKVKRTTEENASLLKRIKMLESQRMILAAQVRKLQASLARCSGQTAQPSTCLLVLIMSLALVLAPTLKNSSMAGENEDEGISMSDDSRTSSLNGMRSLSRNLLFTHKAHEGQCNIEEETKMLTEQLKTRQLPDSNILTDVLETLKLKIGKEDPLAKDHAYFRPRKRLASSGMDLWPPTKLIKNSENVINTLIMDNNNKSEPSGYNKPVVVDILSD